MPVPEVVQSKRKSARAKTPVSRCKTASRGSNIEVTQLAHCVGAEIMGVDLRDELPDQTIADIRNALNTHCVVVFRDQDITPEQHVAFSGRFGKLEHHVLTEYLLPGFPEIYVLSNVKKNGEYVGRAGEGQYWHSDLQYLARPSLGSILHAVEVPNVGGETMFANQIAAYEALSDSMKDLLEGLHVMHHFAKAKDFAANTGYTRPFSDDSLDKTPPVSHPIVRTHPETGRKALYASPGYYLHFVGMTEAESRPLLNFLTEHGTNPRFIYRHKWRTNDVVFWDNRSLMHYAVQDYDLDNDRRHMQRTTVSGDRPY